MELKLLPSVMLCLHQVTELHRYIEVMDHTFSGDVLPTALSRIFVSVASYVKDHPLESKSVCAWTFSVYKITRFLVYCRIGIRISIVVIGVPQNPHMRVFHTPPPNFQENVLCFRVYFLYVGRYRYPSWNPLISLGYNSTNIHGVEGCIPQWTTLIFLFSFQHNRFVMLMVIVGICILECCHMMVFWWHYTGKARILCIMLFITE